MGLDAYGVEHVALEGVTVVARRPGTEAGHSAALDEGPKRAESAVAPVQDRVQPFLLGALSQRKGAAAAEALEALARVSGVDATRLLVLHEVAAEAWQPSPTQPVAATSGESPAPEPRRIRRTVLIGAGTAVVLGALFAGLLVAAPWKDNGAASGEAKRTMTAPSSATAFVYHPGKTYPCALERQKGQLYAGHSTAHLRVLGQGSQGWDVVEVQCLLRHDGFDSGGVDGVYGAKTARAVELLQKKAGLYIDGVVGQHTWQALRK